MTRLKSSFPNEVIRASAGTGKTFQLSNRFLGLTATAVPPDQILATTFARKAAAEILDRVMTRLAEAIESPGKLAELVGHLDLPDLGRAECIALLRGLIQRLHRLRIGTLDSFFVQLAHSFSLELGLPLGWRIVDPLEDRKLRNDAIQAVLAGQSVEDSVRLVHLLSKGEATRSVTRQIEEVVDSLHDLFLSTEKAAWETIPRPKRLEETSVRDALTQLAAVGFPDQRFVTARDKNLESAATENWDAFVSGGLAEKIIAGVTDYYKKPIEPHVVDAYRPLIEHARAELLGRLANQTEGTWQMLARFDAAYRQLKTAERALRFDDVTRALAAGVPGRGVEELAYRLDGPLAHLLLDEFQDTSQPQWNVLKPFAKRVASGGGRSFFCVGDTKQAIYGWRGGVAEIFDSAIKELPDIVGRSLDESFRSAQVVIDTVNRVFADLPGNAALSEFGSVTKVWHARYQTHTTSKKGLAGRCRLLVAKRAAEGEKQDVVTLRFAADHIAGLVDRHPDRTIGVLVRRNVAVARLIYELRQRDVFASEEGGNPLTDSAAVQLVLSLLKLADHPGDTAARFHVATSPLAAAVGLARYDDDAAAREAALVVRERLLGNGYGRTIYEWVKSLAPVCDMRDLNRLLQLVEMAYRLDDGKLRRPDDFIAQIESQRVEDPTAAKVRVMTVHQAKGLQFDIVVLPELDGNVKPQPPRVVIDRAAPLEPIRRVCRYASEKIQKLLPADFQRMFATCSDPWIGESLCVLYVAMTRAVHALDIIIAPSKVNEKTWPKTYAGVLRGALAAGKIAEPETTLFEHGIAAWSGDELPRGDDLSPGSVAAESLEIKLRPSGRRRRGLDYRTPSGLEGSGKVDLRSRLRLESVGSMTRGSIIHAWFERIGWREDGVPDDSELRRVAAKWATPDIDMAAEIKRFRAVLERPAVAAAISQRGYDDSAAFGFAPELSAELRSEGVTKKLYRERSFVVRQDDALLLGAVDRVVMFYRGDKLIAADILDFKTDAVADPAAIEDRVGFYRPQIQAYRGAMEALTSLSQDRISARLVFVEPGVIVSIK